MVLPIKPSPIADAYIKASELGKAQATYPLDLYLCRTCGHVQNVDVVNPDLLFRDYLFVTSSSQGLVEHYRSYAEDVMQLFQPPADSLVVEIGSNDGSLLRFFKNHGMRVLGVDPARDIAREATEAGLPTLPEYFDSNLAGSIVGEHGPAIVVTANNVFAHADDIGEIAIGIRNLLADEGVFVFEASYLVDIVDRFLFDTVYHEHVSYHSIGPLALFFRRLGLELFAVQRISSKGGSIRGFVQRADTGRRPVQPAVRELIEMETERGFSQPGLYRDYAARIADRKNRLLECVDAALARGRMVAGYGASTTTTTLMWHFDLTRRLAFVADDNPRKCGLYCPGSHVPVVPSEELYVRRPDDVVILAWNYAGPIMKRHERFVAEGGRFIVPLPETAIFERS
jgi:hypothetical protein